MITVWCTKLKKMGLIILKPNKLLYKNLSAFLALGFGTGLSKKAPGTIGTLVALPFFFFLQLLPEYLIYLFIVTLFFVGVYVSDKTCQALGVSDPSSIVIDEIVGFLLLLILIAYPLIGTKILITDYNFVLAFILFRIFDIWKPFPINFLEQNYKGGFGIMIDDVGAAIYAYIIFILINYAI